GVISLGEVQEDGTIVWIKERSLNLTPNPYADATGFERFFAYSSLAVLENGDIGLLYEPQPNNLIAYRSFSLRWIFE
ncbi:MAG: sialidase family protein, partial [Niameybacter sp.]